jgi:hypothetical protein
MIPAATFNSWCHRIFPAVAVLFALLLAACSTGNQLGDGTTPVIKGKTPPPVTVQELTGVPPAKAKELREALALAAGQHDIGIVEGAVPAGTYSLKGTFRGEVQAGIAQIAYSWELRDDNGVLIDTIAGSETAGPAKAKDAWAAVTPAILQVIAEATSRSVAAKLSQMGFATRVGSLAMPPAYTFVAAGPGAAKEIDLETLNGPRTIAPARDFVAAAVAEPKVPPEPKPEANKSGKVEIRVVAVVGVRGSPGSGNSELTEAMRRTLKAAGWPVVNKPRADALVIRGKVDLAKAVGAQQQVALNWAVETPQGKSLGDVKQANSVAAGSLDQGWGRAAQAVAEAAASGIFDIIKRYR